MNNLCTDIGWKSLNHEGELLCGDHLDIVTKDDSTVVVLADGLGSGVKASILSTLTSKIISTMVAAGMPLEECINTIASTLPICKERGIAYSTFTLIHIIDNERAEIVQYENPDVIMIRNGETVKYNMKELYIEGKRLYKSVIDIQEGDVFVAMTDGCTHAGIGRTSAFGWEESQIADFMQIFVNVGYNAKTLASMLVDECNQKYEDHPGDDTTACVIKIRYREPMNILFGPPRNRDDCNRMMSLFFSKEGKHIVCGGTTSSIAAEYLHKKVKTTLDFDDWEIPPISEIEGVDLVTEGVITMNKVVDYAKDVVDKNETYELWSMKRDGASRICRLLFEEATDINFYVGKAVNPAHQNPDLPINFHIKMNLVDELAVSLRKMGKRVKISYF